ncbi:restriction endonuclease S subunit [Halanaerobium saccharolyticum]|uniref:Restriction endonuclease S subunit n=1 Tax=Halanaerobium saccharolyticum TaxID=43595 RepID=A0A4R6LMM0_9FIRM|nr:restriction endonuclease subunit S [Halanaerobium saccharolyticum]TDO86474.1 restriction endonuclease S subunit [Halanaerobium saccharolyticum]
MSLDKNLKNKLDELSKGGKNPRNIMEVFNKKIAEAEERKKMNPEDDYYPLVKEIILLPDEIKLRQLREIEAYLNEKSTRIKMKGNYVFRKNSDTKYLINEQIKSISPEKSIGNVLSINNGFTSLLDEFLIKYPTSKFVAQEFDEKVIKFQEQIYSIVDYDISFEKVNPFVIESSKEKYDLIFCNSPLGNNISLENIKLDYFDLNLLNYSKNISVEAATILKALENLKEKGLLFALVPTSLLFTNKNEPIRKLISKHSKLLSIIGIDRPIFKNTAAEFAIIKLRKQSKPSINDSDYIYMSFGSNIQEIKENGRDIKYNNLETDNWLFTKYLLEPQTPDYPTKKLKEKVDINLSSRRITDEDLESEETKQVVHLKSIDNKGKIISTSNERVEDLSSKVRLKAYKGDILMPLIQGDYTPALVEADDFLVSDNFAVISSDYDTHYILWALKTDYFKQQISANTRGKVIRRLPIRALKEFEIPWFSDEKRQQISKDTKESFQSKSVEELSKENQTLINEVLGSYFENELSLKHDSEKVRNYLALENGTQIVPLKEIAEIQNGVNLSRYKGGELKSRIIKSKNLKVLAFIDEFDEVKLIEDKIRTVVKGDILIRRKGDIGPAAIIDKSLSDLTFDDKLTRIRVSSEEILAEYLAIYLNSYFAKEIMNEAAVNKTMKYIKLADLSKLPVVIPTKEKQKEIVKKLV